MRSFFLLLIFMVMAISGYSQSNLVFFTEEGERFWVILNGTRQNEAAETNVRLTSLASNSYKVKVIFEDKTLGEVNRTLHLVDGIEATFNIRQKKTGFANRAKKVGDHLAKDVGAKDRDEEFSPVEEKMVMRLLSETPLAQAPPASKEQRVVVYKEEPAGTVVTQQTTTTVTGTPGERVDLSMNVSETGANLNMNVSVTEGTTRQTSSTTTTTVTQTTTAQPQVIYVEGYAGPVGCARPMNATEFGSAKRSISSKSFEDSKYQTAKQVATGKCLTSAQVKDIMELFTYEESRLEFAKFAYPYTYDTGNYYMVNDAFKFELSISDLEEYLRLTNR